MGRRQQSRQRSRPPSGVDVRGRQASAYDDGERDAYDQDAADDTDDSDYDESGADYGDDIDDDIDTA